MSFWSTSSVTPTIVARSPPDATMTTNRSSSLFVRVVFALDWG